MSKSKQTFFAQKIDGDRFRLENIVAYKDFEIEAPPGRYVIEIKRERRPKSQKQLGNVFGNVVDKLVRYVNDVDMVGIDGFIQYLLDESIPKNCEANADSVKVALGRAIKKTCPEEIKTILYSISPTLNEAGKQITLRDMNTKQAAVFTDRIVNMVAGYVLIPDPDPNWRNKR